MVVQVQGECVDVVSPSDVASFTQRDTAAAVRMVRAFSEREETTAFAAAVLRPGRQDIVMVSDALREDTVVAARGLEGALAATVIASYVIEGRLSREDAEKADGPLVPLIDPRTEPWRILEAAAGHIQTTVADMLAERLGRFLGLQTLTWDREQGLRLSLRDAMRFLDILASTEETPWKHVFALMGSSWGTMPHPFRTGQTVGRGLGLFIERPAVAPLGPMVWAQDHRHGAQGLLWHDPARGNRGVVLFDQVVSPGAGYALMADLNGALRA